MGSNAANAHLLGPNTAAVKAKTIPRAQPHTQPSSPISNHTGV